MTARLRRSISCDRPLATRTVATHRSRRRLAAVARAEARRRLARDRHPREVPDRRAEEAVARARSASATPGRRSRSGKVFVTDRVLGDGDEAPDSGVREGRRVDGQRARPLPRREDRQGTLEARVPGRVRDQLRRRAAVHADRRRRPRLHARRDGRPALPRRRRPASRSGRRTSSRTTTSRLPVWGFAAHPLVDGDKLICLVGGSNDRLVVAFDKKTGKELWAARELRRRLRLLPAGDLRVRRQAPAHHLAHAGRASASTRRPASASGASTSRSRPR